MILFHLRSKQGEEIEVKQAGSFEVRLQEYKYECLGLVSGGALAGGIALAYHFFQTLLFSFWAY